jgi:leader peptidase (prepilin peptidase)/N-methyltransferase
MLAAVLTAIAAHCLDASAPAHLPVDVPQVWLEVALSPWARVFAFAWGAIWGSFANVVIHRMPLGLSVVRPRSRCPSCEHPISGFDNIPVLSYLLLRGKCRHCKAPFSPRYLMVELLAGMLSFATFMTTVHVPLVAGQAGDPIAWQLSLLVCLALLVVVFVDLDHWIIPDAIVLPMTAIGIVVAVVLPQTRGDAPTFAGLPSQVSSGLGAVLAAAAGYGVFAGIRWLYLRTRGIEALGLGDAKLLAMVGAWTGPVGLCWTVGAGAVQGLLVAVPMLLLGKTIANVDLHEAHGDEPELGGPNDERPVMGRHVPFGPFLGIAALEYVLLGSQIDALLVWLVGG